LDGIYVSERTLMNWTTPLLCADIFLLI
jgi:hypothetical protein